MKEECVTYEQAQALKRLGFRDEVFGYYDEFGRLGINTQTDYNVNWDYFISAPTLSHAQKWLREVKGIHVEPHFQYGTIFKVVIQSETKYLYKTLDKGYDTYELALSAGIDVALELLTDRLNGK